MYKLRELERKDLEQINKWRNDSELIALLGAPYRFINLEVDIKWYESYMGNRGNAIRCAIVQENEDKILGLVSLVSINYINQSAEFHIMIGDKENQGKGIGTFAVNAMLYHAFYNMNLRRIELSVLESNERAKVLYEKCGFVYEGIKRQAKFKNGKFEDLLCYSILKDEYQNFVGGGIKKVGNIPFYVMKRADTLQEIEAVIKNCDEAFENPVKLRSNYLEMLYKLNQYADIIYAYNGTILGYVAFYSNNKQFSYISLLAVCPEYQNYHIGRQLLKCCEDISLRKNISNIRLEVRKTNSGAIRFYRSNGFKAIEDKDNISFYMNKMISK